MKRNKFTGRVVNNIVIEFDHTEFFDSLRQHPEFEVFIRPKQKWDTGRMNRYFHGPVLAFVVEQFKILGYVFTKDQIKENLKLDFGPKEEISLEMQQRGFRNSAGIAKSTASYDFKTFTEFLNSINDWCVECFGFELPPSEQVE